MSLINDALRKARQEAAEREAEEKGVAYRPPRAHLPERSSMGMGLVLGLLFGFLGAFAGAYLLLRPSAPVAPESATTQAAAEVNEAAQVDELATPPPPPATETVAATGDAPSVEPAAGETSEEIAAAEAIGSAAPAVDENSPAESPPPAAADEPVPTAAPAPPEARRPNESEPAPADESEPPPAVESAGPTARETASEAEATDSPPRIRPPERVGQVDDTNEFVLEADLGDVRLTLDFIVWIPGRPFAQINGRQVEEGQLVEELLVEKIERERVTLRGANGRLVLRVR